MVFIVLMGFCEETAVYVDHSSIAGTNTFPRGEGGLKAVQIWTAFKPDEEWRGVGYVFFLSEKVMLWNETKS